MHPSYEVIVKISWCNNDGWNSCYFKSYEDTCTNLERNKDIDRYEFWSALTGEDIRGHAMVWEWWFYNEKDSRKK